MKKYFTLSDLVVSVEDTLQDVRTEEVCTVILAAMQSQDRYYYVTERSIDYLLRLCKKYELVAEWMTKNQRSWLWIEDWLVSVVL